MRRRNALETAVGFADQDRTNEIVGPRFDLDHRAVRSDRAAAGSKCCRNKGNVRAALVTAWATLRAGAAVVAGQAAVPRLRQGRATIRLPAKTKRRRSLAERTRGVRQGMRR